MSNEQNIKKKHTTERHRGKERERLNQKEREKCTVLRNIYCYYYYHFNDSLDEMNARYIRRNNNNKITKRLPYSFTYYGKIISESKTNERRNKIKLIMNEKSKKKTKQKKNSSNINSIHTFSCAYVHTYALGRY